ncbi:MAG: flagellar basal-body rod protein FlgF [Bradymonadia bacterium]|jgi:flagellar basal-body rod protein FlgF
MSEGMYVALSGSIARQSQLDIVSNNLANINSTGYRAQRAVFAEALNEAGSPTPSVRTSEVALDMTPGPLTQTSNPLDLGISGDGWFRVALPTGGEAITRGGSFVLSPEGTVTTQQGYDLLDVAGNPVQVSEHDGRVTVEEDGTLWTEYGGEQTLSIVVPQDPTQLQPIGGGLVATPAENLMPSESPSVSQGYLEQSNASPMRGMTEMITLQRYFETMQNLIQSHHDLDKRAIAAVGSVR